MSGSFWTIFILTWMFGPFVLWVSVLGAVRCYYRITLSMMLRGRQSALSRNLRRDPHVVMFRSSAR
jgi:hypothetical protein